MHFEKGAKHIYTKYQTMQSLKRLTLYHTIPTFNDPEKAFENILGKGENAAFSPFPTMFSTNHKKNCCF